LSDQIITEIFETPMTEPSTTSIGRTEIEDKEDVRIIRHWHPNGTLVEEQHCRMLSDGRFVLDGTTRRWNSDGELIGSFELRCGTGTQRLWFDNGQLQGENPMLDGFLTGLQRAWDEGGYLLAERFFYKGAVVSKKRYRELQDTDPSIPRYGETDFRTVVQKRKDKDQ
jgi:hypothetical protein